MRGARRAPSVRDMDPWQPAKPRFRPFRVILGWAVAAAAIWVTAAILPGFALDSTGAAFLGAAVIALINAVLPPALAALRLPFMLATGFLLVLAANAAALMIAREVFPDDIHVGGWGDALLAALLIAAVTMVLDVVLGTNDDDEYSLRVTRRIARRGGGGTPTAVPGIVYLEIDGLALPVLRDAMRDGSAPNMARWIAEDGYRLAEWETDLSSQTGASQAGILLGSNEDIPAFRWVEKESRRIMTCSSPADCAEIEQRRVTGIGLLRDGGASRGNLLSGEADETILTVSRMDAEKRAEPRLPRLPRERLQRHARARAVRLGGRAGAHREHPRGPPRHPPARPPRRHLPADARRALRRRARPDRVRRGDRHDARPPRGLRDVLELRRGRPPLRARARRHDGGAAQARRAVRPDRPRAAVRGAALRDRRPLRPRADPGRHLQAAPRVRARRAGRAVAVRRPGRLDRRRRRAGRARRPGGRRGDRPQREAGEERGRRPAGRRARLRQPRPRLPDGAREPDDARGDRGAPPAAARRAALTSARRLAARPLRGARRARARPGRHAQPGHRARSRARTRSRPSPRRPRAISPGATASRTSPTSWSGRSTTRRSTRAARSRS